MPALDVSELLFDPDFCECFTVYRRPVTLVGGRNSITEVKMCAFGSIQSKDTAIGGNTMEREPDYEYRGAALDVYTNFRLQSLSPGFMPDQILYNGDRYVVTLINDYSHYGAGYIHAECSSVEPEDEPPSPEDD